VFLTIQEGRRVFRATELTVTEVAKREEKRKPSPSGDDTEEQCNAKNQQSTANLHRNTGTSLSIEPPLV